MLASNLENAVGFPRCFPSLFGGLPSRLDFGYGGLGVTHYARRVAIFRRIHVKFTAYALTSFLHQQHRIPEILLTKTRVVVDSSS